MIPTDELEDYRKRTSARRAIPFVIGAVVVAAIAYGVLRPADPGSSTGQTAPTFTLGYLDGNGELSSDELAGHPVVLNFWASWCAPCREEAPLLEEKWREYEDQGVRFIGVVIRDTPESALRFAERFDLTYPMVFDPDRVLARKLGLIGLPQTFFIDSEGHLTVAATSETGINGRLGAIEAEDLDRQIRAMLDESG
jgi:cytochrome c biogenesis protein CcmG/thiol:disulfide interchange protein DsbE